MNSCGSCNRSRRATTTVFLDRDGTINREKRYLSDPDQLELLPGAGEGLRTLKRLGCRLVLVTNQSGIGRGYFDHEQLLAIHARLDEMLRVEQVEMDAFYWCPHHPADGCPCRKPKTGMLERARQELDVDLRHAWMIGDKLGDVETGRRAGITTILVATGYGREHYQREGSPELVDFFVPSLVEAAHIIQQEITNGGSNRRRAGRKPLVPGTVPLTRNRRQTEASKSLWRLP